MSHTPYVSKQNVLSLLSLIVRSFAMRAGFTMKQINEDPSGKTDIYVIVDI